MHCPGFGHIKVRSTKTMVDAMVFFCLVTVASTHTLIMKWSLPECEFGSFTKLIQIDLFSFTDDVAAAATAKK